MIVQVTRNLRSKDRTLCQSRRQTENSARYGPAGRIQHSVAQPYLYRLGILLVCSVLEYTTREVTRSRSCGCVVWRGLYRQYLYPLADRVWSVPPAIIDVVRTPIYKGAESWCASLPNCHWFPAAKNGPLIATPSSFCADRGGRNRRIFQQ